ncbi:MAG: MipA/OmpV family protein [Rhodomicrobium sp.]
MQKRALYRVLPLLCAFACAGTPAHALDFTSLDSLQPSAWIVDLGGYGVFEPVYEGSSKYTLGFKPQIDIRQPGDKEWLTFPNDAVGYNLFENYDFRTGPAANISLQSRFHGEDIDLRLGKADVDLATGWFAEYYPRTYIRTRVELLQGLTGNTGFAANFSADYIWRPYEDWTFTLGPRMQLANDQYASDYFSTQRAQQTGIYVPYRAEGGLMYAGAELTGKYEWTKQVSTKFFVDYNELTGDAADSPHVAVRGSAEQFIAGVGGSYKFAIEP